MSEYNNDRAAHLQQLIYDTIALGSAMQLQVKQLDNNMAILKAPVREANFNIHDTAFAGSIYSLCALTAWGLVHMRLLNERLKADVVIAKADIAYKLPVYDFINTRCQLEERDYQDFHAALLEKGKARIEVQVIVREDEKIQALLNANVAVKLLEA